MEKMTRCPTHPGAVFRVSILEEHGISITRAARALGLSRTTLNKFCHGNARCTPEIAQRIALTINSDAAVWIKLRANSWTDHY